MSHESHKMKIAVMGTGGLGGYFGGMLARAGEDVTFIARGEHLETMREHGLQVFSPRGDFWVKPVQATADPEEVGVVDLILFCVKSYDAAAALQSIKPMIGQDTLVIPVQNGIEHIAAMQAALGEKHVLGGLSMINAYKSAPGVIRHLTNPALQLEFGEWPTGVSPRCEQIQAVLADAGLTTAAVPNICEGMWRKLALFSGLSVFAVLRGPIGSVWSPEAEAVIKQAVAESVAVATAGGSVLSSTLPDFINGLNAKVPPSYKPSLLLDLECGNRLEVEAVSGVVARLGRKNQIPTPVNDFVYACLKPYINGSPVGQFGSTEPPG
jgi:2-dehydropantoate 2-reductase